jgi:hypothetical protein
VAGPSVTFDLPARLRSPLGRGRRQPREGQRPVPELAALLAGDGDRGMTDNLIILRCSGAWRPTSTDFSLVR